MKATQNLNNWQREFGEEHVSAGVTRLLDYIAKCWRPSWYEIAGVLLPVELRKYGPVVADVPHVKEQSNIGYGSNTSPSLAMTNPATTKVHSGGYTTPPSSTHHVPSPAPLQEREAHASNPGGVSTSVVEETNGFESPVTSRSYEGENALDTELNGPLRPRRQARDKALVKIRQTQGQPKKRSRLSGDNASPAPKRRKTPVNGANQHTEAEIEAEEEKQDKTVVENVFQDQEKAISTIKGTPILSLARCLTILTCILLAPAQKTGMPDDTHPSSAPTEPISVEALADPLMQYVKRLECLLRGKALTEDEEDLDTALRQKNALIKDIAQTEGHIQSLKDGLENWSALTDAARKMLGRYHTQDDIKRTLTRQEMVLCLLKTEVNCLEHKIERFRREGNLARAPTCVAEE